jgi:dipeptidyl-peptidase-4
MRRAPVVPVAEIFALDRSTRAASNKTAPLIYPPRMSSKRSATTALFASVLLATVVWAQQGEGAEALRAQIDRIFKEQAYVTPRFGPARWLPDGAAYAIVEQPPGGGGSEIAHYDAVTGTRTVVVGPSRLVPPGRKEPLHIDDYAWSPDGQRLLIFTNTKKVWRDNTRGDYWVLDVSTGVLKQLGGASGSTTQRARGRAADSLESSLMFAKFSPDSARVAYVRANDIYVERLDNGKIAQLTHDGSETTINGTSDWVYEEELFLRDCFRWSPDGRHIAYWQFDTTGVGIFSLIDNTSALYPIITRIPYPKVGTTNSAVRIGIVGTTGGRTRWMRTPGDPRNTYLASLQWIDARTIAMQQLNRLQNRNDYLLADAGSGAVTRAFHDESPAWVEPMAEVPWLDEGRAFLWISERDGWRHVYRVPRATGEAQLITRFDADVVDVTGLDTARGWLYFRASPSNATERSLYRAPLDGSAVPERVTPADQRGTHAYSLAPGGRLAFHTVSRFDVPPSMDVVALPAHKPLRALTDGAPLEAKVASLVTPPVEFLTVNVGAGVVLDGWMLKPPSFDASRKYPVIVHVYGEPWSQTVTDEWGGATMLFHRALAQAGYIVVSFDNRGTPAPKGAAWRKVVYGSIGDLSSREQADAIRALAARHAFIDRGRIGIWGWSGGGTNALNGMFRFPDTYAVGVSVAPVPDQRLYDTIYQERYMGLPADNADGYRAGSAINFAEGLKGKLLIIHGSGDDNVHYQGTERLANRLVELGKPFDLMVYPNRTHAISEGPGTRPHVFHLIARYFMEHLQTQTR